MTFALRPSEHGVGLWNANDSQTALLQHGKLYLHEAGEYVGPFCRRKDAEQFLMLMKLFGENCEGIIVVEVDSNCDEMEQRHCNLL